MSLIGGLFILFLLLLVVLMIRNTYDGGWYDDGVDETTTTHTTVTTTTTTVDEPQAQQPQYTVVGNLQRYTETNGQLYVTDPVDNDKVYVNAGDDLYQDGGGKIWNLV